MSLLKKISMIAAAVLLLTLGAASLVDTVVDTVAPPQAEAVAPSCWQVCEPIPGGIGECCNTCCRTSGGGIVCTDRACP
jgi:hypothetical protein